MKKLVLGFVVAMALVGCGGGDPCDAKSKCSADPVPTAADIAACKSGGTSADGGVVKCSAEAKTFGTCYTNNQVCGSDNKTDALASIAKCPTEYKAYTDCLAKP
jgi:hypothetical protein